jgi:hypothetical protein
VEVRHIEGVNNHLADALSRVTEAGGFKEVVFRLRVQVVGLKLISVMAERVHLLHAVFLDMPVVDELYRKYMSFWAHRPVERDDLVMLRLLQHRTTRLSGQPPEHRPEEG